MVKHIIFVLILLISSCSKESIENADDPIDNIDHLEPEILIDPNRVRAAEIVNSMDDRLLAAQVLITGLDGRNNLPPHMIDLLTEIPAGGVMLFRYNLNTDNDSIRNYIQETSIVIQNESGIPPFIAVDHEGGIVNRFIRGVGALPAAPYYWELTQTENRLTVLNKIKEDSLRAGLEINALGINMNFAPVAEHIIDENRDFITSRSYGPDPFFAGQASDFFIQGMKQSGILCVVKHFPGSAGIDPHYHPSVLNIDIFELNSLILPFTMLINNGARAVMAAHTTIPVIDHRIASLSPVVMQNWLRGDLGFDGIIISDDFTMAAAGNISHEENAVLSIAAGSDIILVWQAHLRLTHQAIISALEDGRLSHERLRDAVEKIIYEKLLMGLME